MGLKLIADWWEHRGRDRIGDLKGELVKFVEDRTDELEKELKAQYGIKESAREFLLVRDTVTKKVIKIYIADMHIKSEVYDN